MQVMIIDADAGARAFLVHAFEAEGFHVTETGDGEFGLRHLLDVSFDLALLDGTLAGPDGFVLRELGRARPELPVVVLSGRDDLASKLRAFELGASDFLVRPFSLDELLARCRVHLRRVRAPAMPHLLVAGRLELDLDRREARCAGRRVALSTREFKLLQFLLEHEDEVVSRERLLSEVWGYNFDPRSNVVDVCIRRLRQRLGPETPIETVRNVGYRAAVQGPAAA